MTPLVVISALLAAPVAVLTVLRVNAMMVFLSLCLGTVLLRFVGQEANSTVGILTSYGTTNETAVSAFLLFLPAAVTTFFMVRTVKTKFKQLLNFLIAIAVGCLVALLVEPMLPSALRSGIATTEVWHYVQKLQVLVIALGAIFSLLFLWVQKPKHHGEEAHHGKHHK
jgi:hypothetical protein